MLRFLWKIKNGGARYEVAAATIGAAVVGGVASNMAADKAASAQESAGNQSTATQRYFYDTTRNDNLPAIQRGNLAGDRISYLLGLSNNTTAKPDQSEANFDVAAYLAANPDVAADGYASQNAYKHYLNNGKAEGRAFTYINAPLDTAAATADPAYGSFTKKFTVDDLNNDVPYQQGFQYALNQGQLGVNRLAAASGSLNSGSTLKALQDRAANVANQYAGDAYNRWNNDKTTQYNMLAGLSGAGQTASNAVASSGANAANAISNTQTGVGNSRAASAISGANSLQGGLNSISNYYQTQNLLSMLGGRNAGTTNNMYGSRGVFSTSDFTNPSGY